MTNNEPAVRAVRRLDLRDGDLVIFECGGQVSQQSAQSLADMVIQIGVRRNINLTPIILRGDVKLRTVLHQKDKSHGQAP